LLSIPDFLNSVRISDCNRPNRYFFESINLPHSASVECTSWILRHISWQMKRRHCAQLPHVRFAQFHMTDRLTRLATLPRAARSFRNAVFSVAGRVPAVQRALAWRLSGLVNR